MQQSGESLESGTSPHTGCAGSLACPMGQKTKRRLIEDCTANLPAEDL